MISKDDLDKMINDPNIPDDVRNKVKEIDAAFREEMNKPDSERKSPTDIVKQVFKKYGMEINLQSGLTFFGAMFRESLREVLEID